MTRLADLRFATAALPRPDAQPEGDVLEHAHVPEQRVVLEDEPHVALAHRLVGGVFAVEVDRALSRPAPGRR